MLTFGIVLAVICIGLLIVFLAVSDKDDFLVPSFLIGAFCLVGILCIIESMDENQPIEKSMTENALKVEIRSIVINGIETKTDTVYIFTPKD